MNTMSVKNKKLIKQKLPHGSIDWYCFSTCYCQFGNWIIKELQLLWYLNINNYINISMNDILFVQKLCGISKLNNSKSKQNHLSIMKKLQEKEFVSLEYKMFKIVCLMGLTFLNWIQYFFKGKFHYSFTWHLLAWAIVGLYVTTHNVYLF